MPKADKFEEHVVEYVPIESITVGDRFRDDYGDLSELRESIKEKGIIQPLTVDPKLKLLAGGRRLLAGKEAGLKLIPVIRRKVTGEIDALEIELYENIHRLDFKWQERVKLEKVIYDKRLEKDPKWSKRKQAEEVHKTENHTSVNRRIELAEMMEAIPELADAKTEDEAYKTLKKLQEQVIVKEMVKEAQSRGLTGLKIAEKNYKLGDCIEGLHSLRNEAYNFIEFDPPYAIELEKKKARSEGTVDKLEHYVELSGPEYLQFVTEVAEQAFRILKDGSFFVCWFGIGWYHDTLAILREAGFKVNEVPCIWNKGAGGQTASPDTSLASSYEPFFYARKGEAKLGKAGRSNVFSFAPLGPSKKIHPTEKPLDLMVEIFETFSFPGNRCVSPVLGSGVSIRAGFKSGRICFGWDLSSVHRDKFLGKVTQDLEDKLYGAE